jgi:uncharacterized protein YbaP (TraB family)
MLYILLKMLNYIAQIITFLAALAAVKGGTWDSNKKGIKKLTLIGRISVSSTKSKAS